MQNNRTYLSWIDDEALFTSVGFVYEALKISLNNTSLGYLQRNIVDPFSLIFETSFVDVSIEDWLKVEAQRQVQKRLSNAVGDFHQLILGSCDGWENLGTGHESGVDLRSNDGSIYAEIKNKYNTIKGSSKIDVLQNLITLANTHKKSTVYMVWIIMERPVSLEKNWVVNEISHPRVKLISGNRFYSLVTGVEDALQQLHSVLPEVIKEILKKSGELETTDITAIREIQSMMPSENSVTEVYKYFFNSAFGSTNSLL